MNFDWDSVYKIVAAIRMNWFWPQCVKWFARAYAVAAAVGSPGPQNNFECRTHTFSNARCDMYRLSMWRKTVNRIYLCSFGSRICVLFTSRRFSVPIRYGPLWQKCEPFHSVVFFFVVVSLIPCKYLIETGKQEREREREILWKCVSSCQVCAFLKSMQSRNGQKKNLKKKLFCFHIVYS